MKCLIIGFGNIAKIHIKYLNARKDVNWQWYDPYVDGGLGDINSLEYDRIFILTPEHTHYGVYKDLRNRGYSGWIFVEKPAVLNLSHFDMLKDQRVFVGLVERYNPAIETLISHINRDNIINIDFSRCCVSKESSHTTLLEDIAIHDLDLYFYLTGTKFIGDDTINICTKNNTCVAIVSNGVIARFIWSKDTFFKERKIIIRQSDCTLEADLQDQIVMKYYYHEGKLVSESLFVEKASPIYNEHKAFFSNTEPQKNIEDSHELLFRLMRLEDQKND